MIAMPDETIREARAISVAIIPINRGQRKLPAL
jgi:hypothetical protein